MDHLSRPSPIFCFEHSFARELEGFYVPWQGEQVPKPRIALFNERLAADLGLELDGSEPELAGYLAGSVAPQGSEPIAQVYAGHQFGSFSPQLGDGRALLLGELLDKNGTRLDLHLKGSGRTPFSRGGDGKAVLGPVLREYVMGEAMHALGIPTSRALAATTTGEMIRRQGLKPGAVLARIASSHIRVGSFQFFAARGAWAKVRQLADYTIDRHYPEFAGMDDRYLLFLKAVSERQANLISQWMGVGFVHGVMNTDNMALSGETIDYGPCAFMEAYDRAAVFSSIDQQGRYAYGNQPSMAQWNLARFAETLVPLIDPENETRAVELATEALTGFMDSFKTAWSSLMGRKIGLSFTRPGDIALINQLMGTLQGEGVDFTLFFRHLSEVIMGDRQKLLQLFDDEEAILRWLRDWQDRLQEEARSVEDIAEGMKRVNPLYIPRNHLVEAALAQAEDYADFGPVKQLLAVLEKPFEEQAGREDYASPAPKAFGPFVSYCGT